MLQQRYTEVRFFTTTKTFFKRADFGIPLHDDDEDEEEEEKVQEDEEEREGQERRRRSRRKRRSNRRREKGKRRRKRRKRRGKRRKRTKMMKKRRHRKGKIYLLKTFTPRTFLLTFVVCHTSTCTIISIKKPKEIVSVINTF